MSIHYIKASTSQQRRVNKFFKRNKTNVSCDQQDLVFFASNSNLEVVAAVLIRKVSAEVNLFRSLYVAPEQRGKGVAKKLCQFAFTQYQHTCFTLCKNELIGFYQSLGFVLSDQRLNIPSIDRQIKKGLQLLIRRPC